MGEAHGHQRVRSLELEHVPLFQEALSRNDNWTSQQDPKERKKAQNRLNQRAARRRKNPHQSTPLRSKLEDVRQRHQVGELSMALTSPRGDEQQISKQSLPECNRQKNTETKIECSRIGSYKDFVARSCPPTTSLGTNSDLNGQQIAIPDAGIDLIPAQMAAIDFPRRRLTPLIPFATEHLPILVHTNIYRAFVSNLLALHLSPYFTCSAPHTARDSILGLPLPSAIPPSLYPTELQMRVPHPEWMNAFPHAAVRDALITRWMGKAPLDKCALSLDLLGAMSDYVEGDNWIGDEEEADSHRRGLIVWGDPWVEANWEATAGFMRKWGWMIKDCKEAVLTSTNSWRAIRGEEPLGWVEDTES